MTENLTTRRHNRISVLDARRGIIVNKVEKLNMTDLSNDRQSLMREQAVRFAEIHRPPQDYNLASEFHSRLVEWINDFDSLLDQEHEVGVRLVSFGQTVVFHLGDIGYWNPSLISFMGKTEDGQTVKLIQHVSQISILLMKLERLDTTKPKKKIGFSSEGEETK